MGGPAATGQAGRKCVCLRERPAPEWARKQRARSRGGRQGWVDMHAWGCGQAGAAPAGAGLHAAAGLTGGVQLLLHRVQHEGEGAEEGDEGEDAGVEQLLGVQHVGQLQGRGGGGEGACMLDTPCSSCPGPGWCARLGCASPPSSRLLSGDPAASRGFLLPGMAHTATGVGCGEPGARVGGGAEPPTSAKCPLARLGSGAARATQSEPILGPWPQDLPWCTSQ